MVHIKLNTTFRQKTLAEWKMSRFSLEVKRKRRSERICHGKLFRKSRTVQAQMVWTCAEERNCIHI